MARKLSRYQYDYYLIYLADVATSGDYDERTLRDIAISEARERARLYCVPCEWQTLGWKGGSMIVRRKRNRIERRANTEAQKGGQ